MPESSTTEEGAPSSDQGDQPTTAGETSSPSSTDPAATEPGEGDDGWETATEIPGEEVAESGTGSGGIEEPGTREPMGDESTEGQSVETVGTESPSGDPAAEVDGADPRRSGDAELERALDVFDGEILEGRKIVLARSNDRAGQNHTATPSGAEETTQGGGTNSGGGALPDTAPRQKDTRSVSIPTRVVAVIPADVPDAKDDDVVARQLREAAMAESDPDLRQALWDDYRRYKSGS